MAAKGQRIGALRWDIVADNSQLVTAIKGSNRMTKDLSRAMKATRTPMERYTRGLLDARNAIKRGAIDGKAYRYELLRLQKQLGKEQAALDGNTRAVNRNTRAKVANRVASRGGSGNLANVLGSGFSGIGAGGAMAGAGRSLGLMSTGTAGIGAVMGFSQLATIIKAGKEYAKLESDIVELQVFMGKADGAKYAEQFRDIARSSSLTTSQLVKNASVIKSYGVELEDIVEFTERLGEASGGDSTQFNNLTKAFAQVNALGKLMGQEKNQLVNAGFSLKLIAREAQIPMDEFAKAMENGLITADHVNQALITATNEGGLFYGRLEAKANTLAGKWDILINSSNEMFAMLGGTKQNWMKDTLDNLINAINRLSERLDEKSRIEKLKEEEQYYRDVLGAGRAPGGKTGLWAGAPGSRRADQANSGGHALREAWTDNPIDNLVEQVGSWWMQTDSLWDVLTMDVETRTLNAKQRLQQATQSHAAWKAKANAAGFKIPEPEEKPFDDANLVDMSDRFSTKGKGTSSGGLSGFSANSIGEYEFLRDKMMGDRTLAQQSLAALEKIVSNTSDEAGTEGRKGWRRRAQGSLDVKKANAKELGTYAFAAGNWLGNGGRTDSQVRADQAFNSMGDPTGGSYEEERWRRMEDIRNKYAVNGLLSSMRSPSGEWLGDGVGYSRFGKSIKSGSQQDMFREEYAAMNVALVAEYKHKKNQDERKEELKAIKEGVNKQESIKGILGNMLVVLQAEAKTLNQEAL